MKNILHIYGQQFEHCDVYIVGDETALARLAHAILGALPQHDDLPWAGGPRFEFETTTSLFCTDGEGYKVRAILATPEVLSSLPLPYSDEPWGGEQRVRWLDFLRGCGEGVE